MNELSKICSMAVENGMIASRQVSIYCVDCFSIGKGGNMLLDYELWREKHTFCVNSVKRLCELNKCKDAVQISVKCNSALCVMNHAMQDIHSYFQRNIQSTAELCFLIRNIDVIITSILDINHLLFGIGLNKPEKAIERCFTNKETICKFRTLRSMVLAHPVDTFYTNEKGESETVYLEDIRPFNPRVDGFLVRQECDYVKRMCKPESNSSYIEPLSIASDILPVICTVIDSIELLTKNSDQQVLSVESDFSQQNLVLDKSSIQSYIVSLDAELVKRYPSAVTDTLYSDGQTKHYSIIYECLQYFSAHFAQETQARYDVFLDYISCELHKIESDLQQMQFNEDCYFTLLYNPDFAMDLAYEKSKMEYLSESDAISYTEASIDNNTSSDALWGIRCFRLLMPYIEEYIPVDVSVSDKALYCQYVAAVYLSNISRSV